MANRKATVVCVIGSGRSGTSAVAHLARELGVYLGPDEHLQLETNWNSDGCWEHLALMNVSLEILKRLGGTPAAPPVFPPGWERAPELEDLKDAARRVIAQDFSGRDLWGWKDPTSCLTLPFWQELIGDMRYVICLRNPVDVAASQERQWSFSFPAAVSSWIERNLSAVVYTADQPRLFFSFDDYFQHPEAHVERLASFIGRPLPLAGTEAHRRIFGTLKSELRTFESPVEKVLADERLTEGDRYFYQLLLAACRAPDGRGEVDQRALLEAYRGASRGRYQKLHGYFQAYATQAETELQEARAALSQARERIEVLSAGRSESGRDGFAPEPSALREGRG